MYQDRMQLFDKTDGGFALYMALEEWILRACPDAEIRAKKTQVGLFNGCGFAWVSPPLRGKRGVTLTLGLPERLSSGRIFSAAEPYPGRWTHHIIITDESDIDDELTLWLNRAIAFAHTRRR